MVEDIWKNFLNPDVLRKRLLTAGLFQIAHEMLIDATTSRLRDFFSDNWNFEKGWKPSPRYKEKVLSLDPKGKEDVLRSSLEWLCNNEVISTADIKVFRELTDARNNYAHELRQHAGLGVGPNFEVLFPKLVDLVVKIDRWWVINVDIATDPDYHDLDFIEEEVMPGSSLILQVIQQVALGNDDEAWELYEQFVATTGADK